MPPLTVTPNVVDASTIPPTVDGERPTLGSGTDFPPLEQTLLDLASGARTRRETDDCEEVLFVLDGAGSLSLGDETHALEPESGAYLAPGDEYELANTGETQLTIISVRIPEPTGPEETPGEASTQTVRRLADQQSQAATTDREFRIVADPSTGLRSATHFVGYIPTAKAPEHFHTYNEVIYVLDGEGVLHAQGTDWRLGAGSCIQLPARSVHSLENTGDAWMRVVAVFRPAGSPAAAYYPDGTPAHADAPPLTT
jgi:quercetin dioxygenase-like cupin family protein